MEAKWLPAALLLALATCWFAVRSVHGIHFLSFGDESGHLVGARALRAGDILYRDFIDAHGPLSFMAAQAFGVAFGWKEPLNARWGIVVIVGLAALAVYNSAAFRHTTNRLWGTAIFLGLISAPWLVQALNMVNYHILCGVLVTIVLAGLVAPAWFDEIITDKAALLCGFCLAFLCADAYSLAPTAVLLALSTGCALWGRQSAATLRRVSAHVAVGFAAGALAVGIWMLCFGDIVGYLVFHVISNQVNYARYLPHGWRVAFDSLIPSTASGALVQSGAAITFLSGLLLLTAARFASFRTNPLSRLLSLALLALGILLINFRGSFGFQDGGFLVASIALFALALPSAMSPAAASLSRRRAWIATFAIGVVLCGSEMTDRAAIASPFHATRAQFAAWPKTYLAAKYQLPIFRRIRSILKPGERLLVLVYDPDLFLTAGFLPIRKYHEYLPWEADYARNPWFGRTRDLCADIPADPPPVILFDDWKVWRAYAPEAFMPCIPEILKKDYVAGGFPHLYIRRDRLPLPGSP